MRFQDRRHAGQVLAALLRVRQEKGALPQPLVLALPRGGVVVAQEVARALQAPLDVVVTRKVGAPQQPEVGLGAVVGDEPPLFDEEALGELALSPQELAPVVERERAELRRREELYRKGRPAPDITGRTALIVDDGLATGSTARAALRSIRAQGPEQALLAVPVCSPQAERLLRAEADEVLCVHQPCSFMAVSEWYEDFDQVTDDEVLDALYGT
ncbi:phosphoribosyltransferase [Streptomyces monticola]|uniref:Phosphoribosyltransferase n=1 Tax=Streptomyces monticola TaxID=2666263 RepID=A0ABW2JW07_9ACTN